MGLSLTPLSDFDIGAVAAALIAFASWRTRTLTLGGAVAAWCVGTATFGALGLRGASILLTFFVSSVALSRYRRAYKRERLLDVAKTGPRDGRQVLANGGVAAACALLANFVDHRYAVAFAGAFAAATADTWGTEIGTLAAQRPRSIVTGRSIATGLSGGVTPAGLAAECAGAFALAAVAYAAGVQPFAAVLAGGLGGAISDSFFGATLQSLRWCPQCRRACEREPHVCGANTTPIRGLTWFDNDVVNLAATLTGALIALALA